MSSKWNESNPNPTRQNPNAWNVPPVEMPPLSFDHDEETPPIFSSANDAFGAEDEYEYEVEEEDNEDSPPANTRLSVLLQLGERFAPVLIPILFSGVTFLLILPVLLSRHTVDVIHIWSIVFVFIAVAVLQGLALSYAGSDNVYWSLSIVGGFMLCLVAGCFALFGLVVAGVLLGILLIVSFLSVYLCMHPVEDGYVDVVYTFGRYKRTLYPGPNFKLPWEQMMAHFSTKEIIWTCGIQSIPVTPNKDVWLKATISYQMVPEDAYLAIPQVENWEESLQEILCVDLRVVATKVTREDFEIWPQESAMGQSANIKANPANQDAVIPLSRLNTMLFHLITGKVAQWGVQTNWVQIALFPQIIERRDASPIGGAPNPPQVQAPAQSQQQAQQPLQVPPAPVVPPPAGAPPLQPQNDYALIAAYQQIKEEKIKSPKTIRDIAERFLAIANDPEKNKLVNFDAGLAAQNLFARAKLYEQSSKNEQPGMNERPAGYGRQEFYKDEVVEADYTEEDDFSFSGRSYREPNDDNITAGG